MHSLSVGHEQDGQAADGQQDHADDDLDGLGQPGAAALTRNGKEDVDLAALAVIILPASVDRKRVRLRDRRGERDALGGGGLRLTCTWAPAGRRCACRCRERSSAGGWRRRDPARSSGWRCIRW